MRKILAAVLVTAIAVLVPATAAHAGPPEPPRPVQVQLLWPLCVTVLSITICIPA
jgi:hypothetical protein